MKSVHFLVLFFVLTVVALFNIWLGASLGLIYCDAAGEQGYSHRALKEGYRAYCEIREVK